MKIQLEISNDKIDFFMELVKNFKFIKKVTPISDEKKDDCVIPQAHKKMVLSRRKTHKKEYLPLSSLDNDIRLTK